MGLTREILERIWNLPDRHVPAIHTAPWWDEVPTNFRASAIAAEQPVPVTERRALPACMIGHSPFLQLLMAGEALLWACFDPILHYSMAGRRLVYACGVTVLLIEALRDGEIVASPWSNDEPRKTAIKRLIALRKVEAPRLNARESYVARNLLPRCNAAISAVGAMGIESPGTNILASGGECPIAVTIGTREIHFALDHRIYDPEAAGALYSRFFGFLDKF